MVVDGGGGWIRGWVVLGVGGLVGHHDRSCSFVVDITKTPRVTGVVSVMSGQAPTLPETKHSQPHTNTSHQTLSAMRAVPNMNYNNISKPLPPTQCLPTLPYPNKLHKSRTYYPRPPPRQTDHSFQFMTSIFSSW